MIFNHGIIWLVFFIGFYCKLKNIATEDIESECLQLLIESI